MPRKEKRKTRVYHFIMSFGKREAWFKVAKDLGQSRLPEESDGDVSRQFNNACQALGERRAGRGAPLGAGRLVFNRVSL